MESGSPQTAHVALAFDPASISDLRSPASISVEVVNEVSPAHVGARQEARAEAGPTLARTEAGPPLARTDAAQQNAGLATEMQTQGDLEEVLSIFSESLSSDASPPLAKRARLAVDDEDFDPARSAPDPPASRRTRGSPTMHLATVATFSRQRRGRRSYLSGPVLLGRRLRHPARTTSCHHC